MKALRRRTLTMAAVVLAFAPALAGAGQACEELAATPNDLRRSFELALATRQALDAADARVAIVARAGQDLSRWGLSWSHAGIAWRDHPAGRWIVTHLLNDCGTAASNLYAEGLANFFADLPLRWEALVVVPPVEAQVRIAAVLAGDTALRMHQPAYSMVAYPYSTRYQNSNQWLLEVIAAAYAGRDLADREESQRWLRDAGYRPTTLNVPTLTRLGGRMFRANITFDDHPPERRWAGRIDTVSVESLAAFLSANGAVRLRLAPASRGDDVAFATTVLK
jgi:hypothetical protein